MRNRILIVDDEPHICQLLSDSLSDAGYETPSANAGEQALREAVEFQPNMILLDLGIPKMDGWGILAKLYSEERTRDIPVVVITGRTDTESLMKPQRKQTLDYFFKPVDLTELHDFIKKHIRSRPAPYHPE